MQILQRYLLSNVLRSPDEPTGGEVDPAAAAPEPTAAAAPEPTVEAAGAAAEPEPAPAEPEPAPAPAPPARAPAMVPLRVLQERVGEVSSKYQQEAAARAEAERRNADYEAIIQRLQQQQPAAERPAAAPTRPAAEAPQNFDAAVKSEAARVRLAEDSAAVRDAGLREFGAPFAENIAVLSAIGVTSDEVVSDLIAVDKANAHKILTELAKDPERAAAVAGMDPRRRIAELTRMADKIAAPVASKPAAPAAPEPTKPAVSRAPAPKPVIAPHAAAPEVDPRTPEGNDKMSDAQWEAWYKATYLKRTG